MATKIRGIEGMKHGELEFEIQRGARFVLFQYCVSVVILTFRRPSDIYFLRQGESALAKGLPFTLLSLVAGWWGIPVGTDLHHSVGVQQFARRQRRHPGSSQLAAAASRSAAGFPDSHKELTASSSARPAIPVD